MFTPNNLKRIISLLNENEKQNVYGEQPAPLTYEDKKYFAESLKTYSQMGEVMYGREKLQEMVERISRMVETASRMISESDEDVVEKVSASRHMKNMESSLKDLQKSANEIMIHERRMAAAYEDIAEGLKKYYDVG
jgi:pyridoxal biosynthesis lyase PdxS